MAVIRNNESKDLSGYHGKPRDFRLSDCRATVRRWGPWKLNTESELRGHLCGRERGYADMPLFRRCSGEYMVPGGL